jgi:hypothetical protein
MRILYIVLLAVTLGTVIGLLSRVYAENIMLNDNKCEIAWEHYQDAKELDNDAVLNDLLVGAESMGCDTEKW